MLKRCLAIGAVLCFFISFIKASLNQGMRLFRQVGCQVINIGGRNKLLFYKNSGHFKTPLHRKLRI
jgi:hypothetical protein